MIFTFEDLTMGRPNDDLLAEVGGLTRRAVDLEVATPPPVVVEEKDERAAPKACDTPVGACAPESIPIEKKGCCGGH